LNWVIKKKKKLFTFFCQSGRISGSSLFYQGYLPRLNFFI